MQAEVRRLELSADHLRALDQQGRYVFALTGHVFNELMLLQKWVHVSRRAPGHPGPEEDAAVAVTMFLVRMLSAKVYEALHVDALGKKAVSDVLRADYFGKVVGLTDKWDAALAQYKRLEWLGWIRQKGGFHYMTATQWTPHLDDPMCEGAYIYVGKRYADTYFHWAEMTAALPAMSHVNRDEPFKGFERMLDELAQLLGDVTACLAVGLQAFMQGSGVCGTLSDPVRFDAPPLRPPALHYFFADERLHAE